MSGTFFLLGAIGGRMGATTGGGSGIVPLVPPRCGTGKVSLTRNDTGEMQGHMRIAGDAVRGRRAGAQGPGRLGRRQGGGFTLTELLVVIGIASVLIGLVVPTLLMISATARQVKCLQHLREQARAHTSYGFQN